MQPEHWKKIEKVFFGALPLPPVERPSFVSEECSGDVELSERILAMLSEDEGGSLEFLETDFFELGAAVIAAEEELPPGRKLGFYEIVRLLGCGGMGAVYLAEDTRLGRPVALKIIPKITVDGHSAIDNFYREARTASRVSHPNIAHIYEFSEVDDRYFIAMEFVDGSTLRELISAGEIDKAKSLDYVKQTALALAAAHRSGVVHGDIKPENIAVTGDGLVKVLDFGLAQQTKVNRPSQAPPGAIYGTVSYMSPEQLRGEPLDERTDIWSLGVVLYELLNGSRPFSADGKIELRESILDSPAPEVRNDHQLSEIVEQCLRKDRDVRIPSAKALYDKLSSIQNKKASNAHYLSWIGTGLLILVLAVIGFWFYRSSLSGSASSGSINSVAVLPFVNAGGLNDREYIMDGLSESLISRMSQIPNLTVKSRSSIVSDEHPSDDPRVAGSELGVQTVLVGRVTENGDNLKLNLSLVDTKTGNQIWGRQYERPSAEILKLQNEIVVDVTERIRGKLTGADEQKLAKSYTKDPQAYTNYLLGRFYWNKRTGDGLKKSIEYYEAAVALDPNFALAYAGMADSYVLFPSYAGALPEEAFPKAEAAAQKALELDESLAEAHTALSFAFFNYDWKFDESEKQISRAIALNPNYSTAYHWYGNANLLALGRFDESIDAMKKAKELDPLSLIINADLATSYCYALRLDEAIAQYNKTLEMDASFYYAHVYLGRAYLLKGDYPKALDELQKASVLSRDPRIPMLRSRIYSKMGRRSDALRMLDELKGMRRERYISNFDLALVYTGLGDLDNAFVSLEKSFNAHDGNLVYLKADPLLADLRGDPRYADLVKRMGLGN